MNIYIMVGNIGSGKTTWVKRFSDRHPEMVVISRDAIRSMIGAGRYTFNPELEPSVFESAILMIKTFMQDGVDILVDEVNVSAEHREDYLSLATNFAYKAIAVVMPKLNKQRSINRRMRNSRNTSRVVWEGVWDNFNNIYQAPTKKEGFYKVDKI